MSHAIKRSPISGGQMVAALVAIVVATAVVPPAAAWTLNRYRVAQTQERVRAAVDRLRSSGTSLTGAGSAAGIVCGPGRLPDPEPSGARERFAGPAHAVWLREAKMSPEVFGPGMPTDAWGRCFLLNAGAASGGPVWLVSAGPNGLIDTLPDAAALASDDIGGRLR